MIPASVDPCLDTFMNTSPGRPSSYSPTVTYPSQSATRNANVFDLRRRGRRSRRGCLTMTVCRSSAASSWATLAASSSSWASGPLMGLVALLGRRERLADLAVVAVDGDRLEAELPGVDVELLDVLDRHVLGQVHRLGDRARDERLDRGHHLHVAAVVDGQVAHRTREDGQVLGPQVRRAEHGVVLVHVRHDLVDLRRGCSRGGAGRAARSG